MIRAKPRNRERGNTMVLALIVMSALATLGTLTVVSVQSSLKASTSDRSQAIALYAAESGAAIVMEWLRYHYDATPSTVALPVPPGTWGDPPWSRPKAWSAYVTANNDPLVITDLTAPDLPSAGALPKAPGNLFSDDLNAWYTARILNNRDDRPLPYLKATPGFPGLADCVQPLFFPDAVYPSPSIPDGFADRNDYDGRVIIQATGHGPQGSTAIIEVEVQWPIAQATFNGGCPTSDTFPAPDIEPPIHPYPDPVTTYQPPAIVDPPPAGPRLTLLGWHVVNL